MSKRILVGMILCILVLTIALIGDPVNRVFAQDARSIVPQPRDRITLETVDPATKMPKNSFCIGTNAIDARLINNSGYRSYVHVINRDTRGMERTLYSGWLEPGSHYLSTLMQTQLELVGPPGVEMLRVDSGDFGRAMPGSWVSFYVQNCGGYPPGGGYGQAFVWARIYPYAIPQGGKGTITLQTTVQSRSDMMYYFEIMNSWDQLWKRLPVSKRPYEQYQVTLPVGTKTKLGMLTYTVKLWLESGFAGERRNVATTQFSFQVVTPGSEPTPYDPGYPGYPGPSPYDPGYSWPPGWDPYGGSPYSPGTPYIPPYSGYPYGSGYQSGYQMGTQGERSIE
jgi:hypothetical protein